MVVSTTWIPSVGVYRRLTEEHHTALAGTLPFTADASLAWIWRQEDVPYDSLWHYVTLEDQLQAAEEALHVADVWRQGMRDLQFHGVAMAAAARDALLHTFRDILLTSRMAAAFFDRVTPQCLVLPIAMGPVELGLRWEAQRRDIAASVVEVAQKPVTHQSVTDRVRRNLRILSGNALWKLQQKGRQQGQSTVIFFGSGADFVNQLHLVEQLQATRPYRVIHVAILPPRASAYSRSLTAHQGPTLSLPPYASLRQYFTLRRLSAQAWDRFQTARLDIEKRWPVIAALDSAFRHFFFHTLSRIGGAMGAAERLLDAHRPELVIVSNDSGGRERAIVLAARQRGIPSVQLIHSGFNDLHFRRFSTDDLWIWGEVHQRQFEAMGARQEQLRITGNPNFDLLARPNAQAANARTAMRAQLGVAEDEILLLLMTAKPPNLLTFVDMEQHVLDLEALCEAVGPNHTATLAIKPHPRYDDTVVYEGLAAKYPWVRVIEGLMLDQLLPACDGALMVNAATTGAVEALLFDKPVIWIRPSTRYPSHFSVFESVVLAVDRRSDIAPTLERFLTVRQFRESVRALGQAHLPNLVANLGGGATDATVAAIDRNLGRRS